MSEPSMADDPLGTILEEFLARFREGERPSVEEFAARHPEHSETLRLILPALVTVEEDLTLDRGEALSPVGGVPRLLGDYRILREIGRGGMGVVYEAVQQSLGRHVALKVLPRVLGPVALERFRLEARAAARLHHTNIVPVFGVGQEAGVHYFAMQFIRGQGLDQVIEELRRLRRAGPSEAWPTQSLAGRLSEGVFDAPPSTRVDDEAPPAATPPPVEATSGASSLVAEGGRSGLSHQVYFDGVARIVHQVAGALAYAHSQGILHRDIKPSNLMLDARGVVWVTDFGLAKDDSSSDLTRTGDVLGTLRYIAPERLSGLSDARADVYALGATLYELLTLRPIFGHIDRVALVQAIEKQDPAPPRSLDPAIPRDLEVICLKCLAKEPTRRYASAQAVEAELARFLDGQPIEARRASSVERTVAWARRNPVVAGLLSALAATFLIGFTGIAYLAWESSRQRDDAVNAAIRADSAAREARAARQSESDARLHTQRLLARSAREQGRSLADRGAVEEGIHWMLLALRQTPEQDADFQRLIRRDLAAYGELLPETRQPELGDAPVLSASLSPDGRRLLTTGREGGPESQSFGEILDASTGARIGDRIDPLGWFEPLTSRRYAAAIIDDRPAYFDLETGRPAFRVAGSSPPGTRVRFSPNDRMVVEFTPVIPGREDAPALARVYRTSDGSPVTPEFRFESGIKSVDFRSDGRVVLVCMQGGSLRRIDVQEGTVTPFPLTGRGEFYVESAVHDPPGRRILTRGQLQGRWVLAFWDADTGQALGPPVSATDGHNPTFSPDGLILITVGSQAFATLRDARNGEPLEYSRVRLPDATARLDFVGDRWLVAGQYGPAQRLLRLIRLPEFPRVSGEDPELSSVADLGNVPRNLNHDNDPGGLRIDPTAGVLAVSGPRGPRLFDLRSGAPIGPPTLARWAGGGPVAIRSDLDLMAAVSLNGSGRRPGTIDPRPHQVGTVDTAVQLISPRDGRAIGPPFFPSNYASVDVSPDGRLIATGDFGDLLRFWSPTGEPIGDPILQENIVRVLAFSPDGTRIAVGTASERRRGHAGVTIWDVARRVPLGPLARVPGEGSINQLFWSRDGARLLAISHISSELIALDGHSGKILGIATFPGRSRTMVVDPNGGRIYVGTSQGTVEVLGGDDLERLGEELAPSSDGVSTVSPVSALAYSPDGDTLAAGYQDGSVRTFDLATRLPVGPVLRHGRAILGLAFLEDSRLLVSASQDGDVRWSTLPPALPGSTEDLTLRFETETGLRLDETQRLKRIWREESERGYAELEARGLLASDLSTPADPAVSRRTAHYAEVRGLWFAASHHLEALATAFPRDGAIRVRLAVARAALGQPEAASATLDEAIRLGPAPACLDLLHSLGDEQVAASRPEVAAWIFDQLVARSPEDPRYLAARAEVRQLLGDVEGRDDDLRRSAERGMEPYRLAWNAETLASEGKADLASRLLDLAAERVGPRESPSLLWQLALSRLAKWELDRADTLFRWAEAASVRFDPQFAGYLHALVALARGDSVEYRRLCRQGLAYIGRDLGGLDPGTRVSLRNSIAWTCVLAPGGVDDPEEIVRLSTLALEEADEEARHMVLNTLGAALLRAGRPREAIGRLEEGIQRRGRPTPQDHAFLFLAYASLGDRRRAQASMLALELALSASPVTDSLSLDLLEFKILSQELERTRLDLYFPRDPFATSVESGRM